jgi:predicted HAD superfamily Cof-like phosphohydrolase
MRGENKYMIALPLSMEEMLEDFTEKYGHWRSEVPTVTIPYPVKKLRRSLILEEIGETLEAMGFTESGDISGFEDLTEIADGIADSVYVLVGTALAYGIPFDRVFREVHRSNMTKTAIKAERGEKYGTKTPKGPDYIAPDIAGIIQFPDQLTELEKKYGA